MSLSRSARLSPARLATVSSAGDAKVAVYDIQKQLAAAKREQAMREALIFYGKQETYEVIRDDNGDFIGSAVDLDTGMIARAALDALPDSVKEMMDTKKEAPNAG